MKPKKRKKLSKSVRRQQVLDAALALCKNGEYDKLKRSEIAARAGVSTGLVTNAFGTMCKLKRAIVGEAIKQKNLKVIGQALTKRDRRALKLDEEIKQKALMSLI